jgi:hypothetical protein
VEEAGFGVIWAGGLEISTAHGAAGRQTLVSIEDKVAKLCAAKAAQTNSEFVVVARTEALIAG